MLKFMLVNKDFLAWLLIGWRLCCQYSSWSFNCITGRGAMVRLTRVHEMRLIHTDKSTPTKPSQSTTKGKSCYYLFVYIMCAFRRLLWNHRQRRVIDVFVILWRRYMKYCFAAMLIQTKSSPYYELIEIKPSYRFQPTIIRVLGQWLV